MGMMFYPKLSIQVPASTPHPEGTEYRVSIGEEDWDGSYQTVIKVQMMYNGKVAGRKSPSYPLGTDDCARVFEAIAEIEERYQRQKENRPVVHIPAKPATIVPVDQFIELICSVPRGCITRWEDMEVYFKKLYATERIEVEPMAHWSVYKGDVEVPYWRIVGTYGYIPDDSRSGGRERQMNNLEAEGLFIEPCGAGNKSRRVKDFKSHLFDLSQVDATIIKEAGFGNTIHSVMLDMMLDPGMYRALSVSQLKQFVGYNEATDPSEKLQRCAELAKAELTRRGIAFPEGEQT